MRAPFLKTLPALLAALILAVSSGCAANRLSGLQAVRPQPSVAVSHSPHTPSDISGIRRGAGEWQEEPADSSEVWFYLGVAAVTVGLFLVYGIVWCGMQIYKVIDEALNMPSEVDDEPEDTSRAQSP